MDTPSGVQRIWRVVRGRDECVGALVEGYVEGVTTPNQEGSFVAYLSFAQSGEAVLHTEPDGRRFYKAPWIGDARRLGKVCESITEALDALELSRAELIEDGWLEDSLNPIDDPDSP
jgi:hypothetical protein